MINQMLDSQLSSVLLLNDLKAEFLEDLQRTFKELDPSLDFETIQSKLGNIYPDKVDEIVEIFQFLVMFHRMHFDLGNSRRDLALTVCDQVVGLLEQTEEDSSKTLNALMKKLEPMIEIGTCPWFVAKAVHLITENYATFDSVDVISDIRPIMTTGESFGIVGAVVTHDLKIEYYEDDQKEEFYLTMDGSDLKELARAIQIATRNHSALVKHANDSNLQVVDFD